MKEMTSIYGESLEVLTASGLASGMLFSGRMLAPKATGDKPLYYRFLFRYY